MCACGAGAGDSVGGWHVDTIAQMYVSIKWAGEIRANTRLPKRDEDEGIALQLWTESP